MSQEEIDLIHLILKDPEINTFCRINKLTNQVILENLGKFVIQKDNNLRCQECRVGNCTMDPYGMQTQLQYNNNKVELSYYPCPNLEVNYLENLDLRYFPNSKEFLDQEIDITAPRAKVLDLMKRFVDEYEKGKFTKGIYFYGPFGTGKTFLMIKLARMLSKKGVKVLIAYYPDLVRYLKSSIATGELEKLIITLKYCEVLILDDVGAEGNSAFIRDEILGPILQFRLQANFPLLMTSNLSLAGLRNHFMEAKDSVDKIKSDRIIERLRYLMNEVILEDKNYRTNLKYEKKD
ncbi:MAG: ATP-binding protein [Bacilli bacterium]|nr:ATP-binding protein [Bacilli bacterium]